MTRVVALHGVATGPGIWRGLADLLVDVDFVAPQRACSGDLATELEQLAPLVSDSWIVGLSGGATLGLALAASGVHVAGALLHEPAVGSLLPGLLAPMRTAFEGGGTVAFARALYGPSWVAPDDIDEEVTARELAMFSAFEPRAPHGGQGPVLVTSGADSPAVRRLAARALQDAFGMATDVLPGTGHDVAHENPGALAARLERLIATGA